MSSPPHLSSKFTVSSGSICFGALHNIHHGMHPSSPRQPPGFPTPPLPPEHSGTVKVQPIPAHNLPAQNGIWNVHPLVDLQAPLGERDGFVGYFLAHEDVDARHEIRKILRVAPSPYEDDADAARGSSRWNDDNSAAHGVWLVNRYDWGWVDRRGWEDCYAGGDGTGDEIGYEDLGSAVGLVDYEHAREVLERWRAVGNREREQRREDSGVWMWLRHHEYEFGRFGFDEGRERVQSFLFFSTYTDFTRTGFQGVGEGPLREERIVAGEV